MEAKPSHSCPGPVDSLSSRSAYPVILAGAADRQPESPRVPSVGPRSEPSCQNPALVPDFGVNNVRTDFIQTFLRSKPGFWPPS